MAVLVTVPTVQCLACEAPLSSPDPTLVRLFTDWDHAFYVGAYAELLALFLLIWFLAHLHGELRQVAPGRIHGTVVLLAGALFGAALLVQIAALLAATTVDEGGGATVARMVFAVGYNFAFVFAAPVAAIVGATSLAIIRARWLPRALGWAGLVVVVLALAWITPGVGAVAGMGWLAVLSVCLAVRAARTSKPPTPVPTAGTVPETA